MFNYLIYSKLNVYFRLLQIKQIIKNTQFCDVKKFFKDFMRESDKRIFEQWIQQEKQKTTETNN